MAADVGVLGAQPDEPVAIDLDQCDRREKTILDCDMDAEIRQ